MSKLTYWIKLSRPRFWLYVLGPYLLGLAGAIVSSKQWWRLDIWLWFGFFLLPANLYLYGINDLFDSDTDAFNLEKKGQQEVSVQFAQKSQLRWIFIGVSLLAFAVASISLNLLAIVYLAGFFVLATAYSMPPFRFKSRPLIDFLSNILYVLPAGVSWALTTGKPLPWLPLLTGGVWCGAMHLFSAIPDINADSQAGLKTTAVVLGKNMSLVLCSLLWFTATVGAYRLLSSPAALALVYSIIPLLLLHKPMSTLRQAYWYFPVLNGLFGFGLFWLVVLK